MLFSTVQFFFSLSIGNSVLKVNNAWNIIISQEIDRKIGTFVTIMAWMKLLNFDSNDTLRGIFRGINQN